MDNWNDVLQRMRAHTPLTKQQLREEIEAEEKRHDEITRTMTARLKAGKVGMGVGISLFMFGAVTGVAWAGWWLVLLAGVVIFAIGGLVARFAADAIEIADAGLEGARHAFRPIPVETAAKIAALSEQSPEFARIVQGWLDVCDTLSGRESIKVYDAKEAYERHLAEQRIRSSGKGGGESTDKAA
jgi:hypothetical protein